MRPQAILFDLGGVLLDVHLERTLAHWAAAADPSGHLAADELRGRLREDDAYRAFECGRSDASAFFAALSGQLAIELDQADWTAGWLAMLGDVRPEMARLVEELARESPLFLFSNTNETHHAVWQESCKALLANFRDCFVSHRIGMRKPGAEAFAAVVERIGLPAGDILFLDDLPANVAGARLAGLRAERVASHSEAIAAVACHEMPIDRS